MVSITSSPRFLSVLSLLLPVASGDPVVAQALLVQGIAAHSDHALLGGMQGMGVVTGTRLKGDDVLLRFHFARLWGVARRNGVSCAGLFPPGSCPEEPIRDNSRATTAGLGVSLPVTRRGMASIAFNAGLSVTWVRADAHGLSSGRTLSATKTLRGLDLGVESAFSPWRELPVALVIGTTVSALGPLTRDDTVDGYTPFENTSLLGRLWIGFAWYRRAR